MRLFDEKFKEKKRFYITQSLFAGIAVSIVLCFFDVIKNPVIIASFGASAFLAFTVPRQKISSPRRIIFGYITGIIVGGFMHFAVMVPIEHMMVLKGIYIISGGIAVALAMFFMSIFNCEHAPAAGVSLGLVISEWHYSLTFLLIAGISLMALIKTLLKPKMIDLF